MDYDVSHPTLFLFWQNKKTAIVDLNSISLSEEEIEYKNRLFEIIKIKCKFYYRNLYLYLVLTDWTLETNGIATKRKERWLYQKINPKNQRYNPYLILQLIILHGNSFLILQTSSLFSLKFPKICKQLCLQRVEWILLKEMCSLKRC